MDGQAVDVVAYRQDEFDAAGMMEEICYGAAAGCYPELCESYGYDDDDEEDLEGMEELGDTHVAEDELFELHSTYTTTQRQSEATTWATGDVSETTRDLDQQNGEPTRRGEKSVLLEAEVRTTEYLWPTSTPESRQSATDASLRRVPTATNVLFERPYSTTKVSRFPARQTSAKALSGSAIVRSRVAADLLRSTKILSLGTTIRTKPGRRSTSSYGFVPSTGTKGEINSLTSGSAEPSWLTLSAKPPSLHAHWETSRPRLPAK